SPIPVVIVVLDELPYVSLLGEDGKINGAVFPNFARLAETSTEFERAYTLHDFTSRALPAIATGKAAERGKLALVTNYPRNLFAYFGEYLEYEMHVFEFQSRLCPTTLCRALSEDHGHFARVASVLYYKV